MKRETHLLFGLVIGLAVVPSHASTHNLHLHRGQLLVSAGIIQSRNSISGTVFGTERHPVDSVYVELLDDVNSTLGRMKTDGSGRFSFNGLASGRFYLRVLPYGTDYLEQTQEVVLSSVSLIAGGGADRQQVDIYLKLNERASLALTLLIVLRPRH